MTKSVNPRERFPLASNTPKPRLIARSGGEIGSGKTYFWLGAPAPILVMSFDQGLEGVVEEFRKENDKEIRVAEYEWTPTRTTGKEEAEEVRDQFLIDYYEAITTFKTVVIDKETDLWKVFRYAEFGRDNNAPKDYPKLYADYRKFVNAPKPLDCNVGFIQGMTGVWGSRAKADGTTSMFKTAERELQGCDEVDGLVHLTLFHRREAGQFYIDVGKSRGPGGHAIQDTTIGPNFSFSDFAELVYPDTSSEDWM